MENETNIGVVKEADKEDKFKYNFISKPWDDRSTKSKVGIVALLISIFAATVTCVLYNILMHYSEKHVHKQLLREIQCHLVKMGEYPYVARIHSAKTQEVLCVGAVVGVKTVLSNDVCVSHGPVRLRLGSFLELVAIYYVIGRFCRFIKLNNGKIKGLTALLPEIDCN
jgi:hypothetical protein